MKMFRVMVITLLCLVLQLQSVWAYSSSVAYEQKNVNGKTVQVVTVDYNNTNLRFDIIKGNDRLYGWESFAGMISRKQPIAAINGNYFNAYATEETSIVPWGYIYQHGIMINSGSTINHGAFASTFDRKLIIDNAEEFSHKNVETMVEAGPLLLLGGRVVYSPDSGDFAEPKIIRNAGQRSAIGIKPDGRVLLVTGGNLTMVELADIMLALGCTSATNLDGGASSALYANGRFITNPGRMLNTLLVVYEESTPMRTVRVALNGKTLIFDVAPRIVDGRTMVPLRGIFEALNVPVAWNAQTQTVTAETKDVQIVLSIGSRTATVNGRSVALDVPGILVDGRTLVPVRFIAESLGAKVTWNGETSTVGIIKE